MKKEDKTPIIVLLIVLIILFVLILILYYKMPTTTNNTNLSFIDLNCSNYSIDNCPNTCVVCPPCATCSSVSCNTEEFCSNMGFNRTWFENIKEIVQKG